MITGSLTFIAPDLTTSRTRCSPICRVQLGGPFDKVCRGHNVRLGSGIQILCRLVRPQTERYPPHMLASTGLRFTKCLHTRDALLFFIALIMQKQLDSKVFGLLCIEAYCVCFGCRKYALVQPPDIRVCSAISCGCTLRLQSNSPPAPSSVASES